MNKNGFVYSTIFIVIMTILFVMPLAVASKVTKPIGDEFWRVERYIATLKSLGIPASRQQGEEAKRQYLALEKYTLDAKGQLLKVTDESIDRREIEGKQYSPLYYVTNYQGETRYAGSFTGPGLWGNVTLAVGVNHDVSRIEGMEVLFQVETPGLGGRIGEPWFSGQFGGQKVPAGSALKFIQSNGKAAADKEDAALDGITGATVTSTAVRDIVNNQAIPELRKLMQTKGGAQ